MIGESQSMSGGREHFIDLRKSAPYFVSDLALIIVLAKGGLTIFRFSVASMW